MEIPTSDTSTQVKDGGTGGSSNKETTEKSGAGGTSSVRLNGAGQRRCLTWNVYPEHLRPASLAGRSNG